MNRVVKILMRRDGMTHSEAVELVGECAREILRYPEYADDTIRCDLGLEPDYIMDVIGLA